MNKEDYFIQQFKKQAKNFIGDDGAVIGKYVYSMDAFFENVHFKRQWCSLKHIAQKAMLVNISDAIVMNAKPKYALLTVAIPKTFSHDELKQLAKGFKSVAKEYGITIIGGDTIANEKLDISVTIISTTKNPILRSGTKKGDLIAYTGELGSCKEQLEALLKGEKLKSSCKFLKPKLKPAFFYEVASYINSAMDISDGLYFELERLSKANDIGFEFLENISNAMGSSGEEYEILFSFNKKDKKTIEKIAKKHGVKLNICAKAVKGKFRSDCKNHHF